MTFFSDTVLLVLSGVLAVLTATNLAFRFVQRRRATLAGDAQERSEMLTWMSGRTDEISVTAVPHGRQSD